MSSSGRTHRVQAGDSIASLAYENGLFWKTVWEHEKNAPLRKAGRDPCCLAPDDEVFIPDLRVEMRTVAVNQRHRFRRKGVPSVFRLRVYKSPPPIREESERDVLRALAIRELILSHPNAKAEDAPEVEGKLKAPEPWAGTPFVADVDAFEHHEGKTNSDGVVEFSITPNAERVRITLAMDTEDEKVIEVALGHLDPIDTERGVWQRLRNLGLPVGEKVEDFEAHKEQALRLFQLTNKLDATGELDDATRVALRDGHGR
jgi:hypothetical protein